VPGPAPSIVLPTTATELTPKDAKNIELMDESTMDDAEEAQLMIDDPLAFERMQIQRDIERNRFVDDAKA